MSRLCNSCGHVKPLTEFGTCRTRHKDGSKGPKRPRSYCKQCGMARVRLTRYGITSEQYRGMLKQQDYVCAICGKEEFQSSCLSVDHDHKTGEVRGLLCHICNRKLGEWEDNYDRFTAYIKRPNAHADS